MLQRMLVSLFLIFSLLPAAWAAPASTPHVTAELLSEQLALTPGKENIIGLRLQMAPDWHTYWRFPGDSGLPTEVKWTLPSGWKAGETLWPLPERILLPPLVNYGFSGETLLGFPIKVPAGAKGSFELRADVSWLVCKEECIPEKVTLSLPVDVRSGGEPGAFAGSFAKLKAMQPKHLDLPAKVLFRGQEIGIEIPTLPKNGKIDFFPLIPMVLQGQKAPVREGNSLWMKRAEPFDAEAKKLKGVLVVGAEVFEISPEIPVMPAPAAPATKAEAPKPAPPAHETPWIVVALAFLGGMVLNLMPCVFPVLGIKVMTLLKQGGMDASHGRRHGFAYAFGILLCFWALAAVLLSLRSAGQAVGWGFQLQQPSFVAFLVLLFSFVAADLAGFVRWTGSWMGAGGRLADRSGYMGSFFTGMLAVLVATPCTAPFMGTAIGATISEPGMVIFLVFTSLALGLAAPFVVLCFHPAYLRFLPKPGAWMESLKKVLALPIAATVAWLLWVLSQQVAPARVLVVVLGLVLLLLAILLRHRSERGALRLAGNLLFALGLGAALTSAATAPAITKMPITGDWLPYSESALEQALNAGKPVFVDFTAAWCLTCQVNKRLVMDREEMRGFFRERGVVLLLADWTNRDPEITRALERRGRLGVPLYLAYPAGSRSPNVLPQVLTPAAVREAF